MLHEHMCVRIDFLVINSNVLKTPTWQWSPPRWPDNTHLNIARFFFLNTSSRLLKIVPKGTRSINWTGENGKYKCCPGIIIVTATRMPGDISLEKTDNFYTNCSITPLSMSMSRQGSAPSRPLSHAFTSSSITAVLLALGKRSLGGNEAWQENKAKLLKAQKHLL